MTAFVLFSSQFTLINSPLSVTFRPFVDTYSDTLLTKARSTVLSSAPEKRSPSKGEIMPAVSAPELGYPNSKPVAPEWHTALLAALFLAIAVSGALFQRHAQSTPGMMQVHPNVIPLYLSLIAMEWGLFLYVWRAEIGRASGR